MKDGMCVGGGAQRSARSAAAGSKPKPPKPPVRMDSMPPPEAKLLNVAPALLPPQSASVAMDPAAVLGALNQPDTAVVVSAAASASMPTSPAAAGQVQEQQQRADVEMVDRAQLDGDRNPHDRLTANGEAACRNASASFEGQVGGKEANALPQLGLTLSPHCAQVDGSRSLLPVGSKATSRNGRKSSTPRGNTPRGVTPRAGTGRPPKGGSGYLNRQEGNTADRKDNRKLMRRNTTG